MKFLVLFIVVLVAFYGGYKLLFSNYPWRHVVVVEIGKALQLIVAIGLMLLYHLSKFVSKPSANLIAGSMQNG